MVYVLTYLVSIDVMYFFFFFTMYPCKTSRRFSLYIHGSCHHLYRKQTAFTQTHLVVLNQLRGLVNNRYIVRGGSLNHRSGFHSGSANTQNRLQSSCVTPCPRLCKGTFLPLFRPQSCLLEN